jgi:hypothetical protein
VLQVNEDGFAGLRLPRLALPLLLGLRLHPFRSLGSKIVCGGQLRCVLGDRGFGHHVDDDLAQPGR